MLEFSYLDHLFDRVCASDLEMRNRHAAAERTLDVLRRALPPSFEFEPFGSTTRGTCLSANIDPASDVDILCQLQDAPEGAGRDSQVLQLIAEAARANPLFSDVRYDQPCVDFNVGGVSIQVFPAFRVNEVGVGDQEPEGTESHVDSAPDDDPDDVDLGAPSYIFRRPWSASDSANYDLMERYIGAGATNVPAGPDGEFIGGTRPLLFNRLIEGHGHLAGYQSVYGDVWRCLIVIWKYWRTRQDLPISSYIIEDNVFGALSDPERFNGCSGLLDCLQRMLSNTEFYHYDLFSRYPAFDEFKESVETANNYVSTGDDQAAIAELSKTVPFPNAGV